MTPAPFDPRDPDPGAVASALAGRPLVAPHHRTRGWCLRCQRKNDVRSALGREADRREPTFRDGERIALVAVAKADEQPATSAPREHRWGILRAFHRDHPLRRRAAVARPGVAQVRIRATVRAEGWVYGLRSGDAAATEYDPDALVLRAVDVEWVSPQGHGTPPDWDDETGPGAIELAPGDPRPDWPPAENEWLRRVVRRHGDDQ